MHVVSLYMISSLTIPLSKILLVLLGTIEYVFKGFDLIVKVWVYKTVNILDVVSWLDCLIL